MNDFNIISVFTFVMAILLALAILLSSGTKVKARPHRRLIFFTLVFGLIVPAVLRFWNALYGHIAWQPYPRLLEDGAMAIAMISATVFIIITVRGRPKNN